MKAGERERDDDHPSGPEEPSHQEPTRSEEEEPQNGALGNPSWIRPSAWREQQRGSSGSCRRFLSAGTAVLTRLLAVFQEECMIRFKMLAELVQKRRQAKS